MFCYNSWFNFSLYYFGLLIALAVVCEFLLTFFRLAHAPTFSGWERVVSVAAVLAFAALFADKLRIRDLAAERQGVQACW